MDVGQHHLEGLDGGRAGDAPDGLADPLLVREVIEGLRALCGLHQRLQRRVVAVGEEDRTRLAARRADVADAVLLLGAAGALVAADDAVVVVVERARGYDARLLAPALLQTVEVVAGAAVAHQGAVGHALAQELGRVRVDVVGVHVVVRREARLGAVYGQKGAGVLAYVGGRPLAVKDVVGQGGKLRGGLRRGAVADKGLGVHGTLLW